MGDMKQFMKDRKEGKKPAAKPSRIKYSCGCEVGVKHLEGKECPGCARKRAQARNQARAAKYLKRPPRTQLDKQGRLPHGARFQVAYDADAMLWAGTLTVGDLSV